MSSSASGVQEALEKLRAMGALGCAEVQVTDFLYMDVDTTEETARLAAFLATLSAFLDTSQMPSLRLSEDHRRFLLDWPDQEQT
jgi:hypothetical protein